VRAAGNVLSRACADARKADINAKGRFLYAPERAARASTAGTTSASSRAAWIVRSLDLLRQCEHVRP
jgi:hypothetical protein